MNSIMNCGNGIHKGRIGISFIGACFVASVLQAKNITWVGNNNNVWDGATANWSGGQTFSDGDDVTIDDTSQTDSVMMNARLYPHSILFNINRNMSFGWGNKNSYGLGVTAGRLTKRGTGTLLFCNDLSGTSSGDSSGATSRHNGFTNGVDIVEGEIALKNENAHNYLGPRTVPFWVHVFNGASLTFLQRNQTGSYLNPECGICIQIDEGGRLNNCTNATDNSFTGRTLPVNTLRLNGGDIVTGQYAGNYDEPDCLGGKCSIKIFNTLWFSGSTPHAFGYASYDGYRSYSLSSTFSGYPISLNPFAPVEFRVDDITGDDSVDAYVNMKMFTWGTNTVGVFKSDIVKTGEGTLVVPTADRQKVFYGDLTVAGGLLELAAQSSLPYDQISMQTLTASNGATIAISTRNAVAGTIWDANGDLVAPKVKLVVDGGTFKYHTASGSEGLNRFAECVFNDATIDISNPGRADKSSSEQKYGVHGILAFMGPVRFSGSTPYVLDVNTEVANNSQAIAVFNNPRTTFEVSDITADGAADVTIGMDLYSYATNDSNNAFLEGCGFVKTGMGTLRITSSRADSRAINGPVDVSNGVLRVDGGITRASAITVASGGFIGGTGTVANVTLEAGAGFVADVGQSVPLAVQGDLVIPATGSVNLCSTGADEPGRTDVASATGTLTGAENLRSWTVLVDGVPTQKYRLSASGKTIRAKPVTGFVISYK